MANPGSKNRLLLRDRIPPTLPRDALTNSVRNGLRTGGSREMGIAEVGFLKTPNLRVGVVLPPLIPLLDPLGPVPKQFECFVPVHA